MSSSRDFNQIRKKLSPARFLPYEQVTHTMESAFELYAWNMRVSAEFWFALQICEVVLRNAVSSVLNKRVGSNWAWDKGFLYNLPSPKHGFNPRQLLIGIGANYKDINALIPELNFAFWQTFFTSRYDTYLWNIYIKESFPNALQPNVAKLREEIYRDLNNIRSLRNRIAHHEPIFKRKSLMDDYYRIYKLIAYQCHETADWFCQQEQIRYWILCKP